MNASSPRRESHYALDEKIGSQACPPSGVRIATEPVFLADPCSQNGGSNGQKTGPDRKGYDARQGQRPNRHNEGAFESNPAIKAFRHVLVEW